MGKCGFNADCAGWTLGGSAEITTEEDGKSSITIEVVLDMPEEIDS
jgi:hypothetical protein